MRADRVYDLFEEIVNPQSLGLVPIRRGTYAKPAAEHIFHLIRLLPLKGASYGIRWGASLTYVPYGSSDKPRWHRTLKSSNFDLFEDPFDYPPIRNNYRMTDPIPALYGEDCFQIELNNTWHALQPIIAQWFNTALTLVDIADRASEQMHRNWHGPRHYPDARFVYALTLAKLGKGAQANSLLQELAALGDGDLYTYDPDQLLAKITADNLHT